MAINVASFSLLYREGADGDFVLEHLNIHSLAGTAYYVDPFNPETSRSMEGLTFVIPNCFDRSTIGVSESVVAEVNKLKQFANVVYSTQSWAFWIKKVYWDYHSESTVYRTLIRTNGSGLVTFNGPYTRQDEARQ